MQLVFYGHNDVLLRLWRAHSAGIDPVRQFIDGTTEGHIDAPRAKAGGLAGGLCAIYIPSMHDFVLSEPDARGHYNTPVDTPLPRMSSLDIALQMAGIAFRLERAGGWRMCRSTSDIRASMADGIFAAVLHMEGCEAIDADLATLETLYAAGLRSLGPVWSRHNIFGHGVPFAYPMSPDTGPGLTPLGFELVKMCNTLGIAVDLAHITEKGFWDVAKTTTKPLIASHEPVKPALCASCLRVLAVRSEERPGEASGLGVIGGAVIGGLLGSQVGGGSGKKLATIGGAVAGGYAGNEIEKRHKSGRLWIIKLEHGDGRTLSHQQASEPGVVAGDIVELRDGELHRH